MYIFLFLLALLVCFGLSWVFSTQFTRRAASLGRATNSTFKRGLLVPFGLVIVLSFLLEIYWGAPFVFFFTHLEALVVPIIGAVVIFYLWLGYIIGNVAEKKGRSFQAFFWLTLLVSPLIMAIIAASISDRSNLRVATVPSVSGDLASQLSALKELHTIGALTDKQFEAAKAKLL